MHSYKKNNTESLTIQNHTIGIDQPAFIIAEAGVNHNGDINLAKQLVAEAKKAGANCVKFQTFKADRVATECSPKANYQLKSTDPNESQLEMLRKLELGYKEHRDLIQKCNEENIIFLSTPYNHEDADFLDEIGIPAFKLASIHIAEPSFLQYVAQKGKPIILSTGMATLAEVDDAVRAIQDTGNNQLALLQCTTNYPSKLKDANLHAMQTMRDALNVIVGYSDHTQTDTACIVAIGLGANVIEKHFTLDKILPGPDQSSSSDPDDFYRLVKSVRDAELSLGSSLKRPAPVEVINAQGMRRSIVARKNIKPGSIINEELVTFKRPATGISPRFLSLIIGKTATREIITDEMLQWSDIC